MSQASPQRSLAQLRADYPTFVYEGYEWRWDTPDSLSCAFHFRAEEHSFRPTCRFVFSGRRRELALAPHLLDSAVFHLGLAELPSYWKATCSPTVDIRAGALSPDEVTYWERMLTEGMSEFHYVNRTSFTDADFVTVVSAAPNAPAPRVDESVVLDEGFLVPVGGGKDSLLTLALLGQRNSPVATIAINPPPSTHAAIALANVQEQVVVERTIDPHLLELNRRGYLNGHTPFGAVIAMTSALAALVLGRKHIVLSNESSSDYAKLEYRGATINHQYGKSTAFEVGMRAYLKQHIAAGLHYFSLLRPFNELQIAQRFSRLGHFYPVFRSCNRGRKSDAWCGGCPKCLSTFILLAPFMPHAALVEAVGIDMLEDPECMAMLPSLLGQECSPRPFECIATPEELHAALALRRGERLSESALDVLTQSVGLAAMEAIPEELHALVQAALRPRAVPLLQGRAACVLGLGSEGASTCRYLLSTVDSLDLLVIDDDPSAASRLPAPRTSGQHVRFMTASQAAKEAPSLPIVFKSPGVSASHPLLTLLRERGGCPPIISSNTALFFERCRGTTIGVTGTKGKSTAASLIAHVLRGRDVRLVGNIGRPCLDSLEGADADSIFCVELSSFQLEDLHVSPDIAVVLGIFPDHLDRHGDMNSYVAAKSAITRYQGRGDLVLYSADCSHAAGLAELSPARRVPITYERPPLLGASTGPLLGAFNHSNIWPAVHIGRHFGIDDADLASSLRSFRPLPGRLETVTDKDGLRFVCDIRSTAPEVTVAALDALADENVKFLFLGGVDRQQDYRKLLPALRRSTVEHLVLFPPTGERIKEVVTNAALSQLKFFEPKSMEDAVRYVYAHASPERSVCLMSTAAPSNGGLFTGPEDKARQFAHWSSKLGREVNS
ncbi:MAG: UDP-N-acetylmuramoyl-L-alanine--D-glutamate ligase [Polyangiales bacterium]